MARVTHVKAARASKRERSCRKCGKKINVGDSFYWWKNRAPGMRSGVVSIQCAEHPPSMADRTPGRRGQLYGIQEQVETDAQAWHEPGVVETDGLEQVAQSAAEELRSIAEEIREGAENIEEGFGHATSQSEEMAEKADELESVCDDLEQLDFPEPPEEPGDFEEEEPDETKFEDQDEFDDALAEFENAQEAHQQEVEDYETALEEWRQECVDLVTEKVNEAEV